MRKHLEQMTSKEVSFLKEKVVQRLLSRDIEASVHFNERLIEKKVNPKSIANLAEGFEVIEFEKQGQLNKVVLRTKHCKNSDLVIVIILGRTNFIKTVWLNKADDLHKTLDLKNYNSFDVVKTFCSKVVEF